MMQAARSRLSRTSSIGVLAVSMAFLASCGMPPQPKSMVGTSDEEPVQPTKEYFASAEYGVKASPRVSTKRTRLPRGGGRDQIGKPYKVKGKWYTPREDRNYSKVGGASWYGDAFHGRLTANGEIYDMTHLTAAHPTMPLPSYARVTNMKNGASIVVRVNDRGPYSRGRIIDLSKRAAQMLDYTHTGVAKVKVDYLGRAPLHGQDEEFLLASYKPNGVRVGPSSTDDFGGGVMVAMGGRTPSGAVGSTVASASAFPGVLKAGRVKRTIVDTGTVGTPAVVRPAAYGAGDPVLPAFGPIAPERPTDLFVRETSTVLAMSYAEARFGAGADPFAALDLKATMTADDVVTSWKKRDEAAPVSEEYVAAGVFATKGEAEQVAEELSAFALVIVEPNMDGASVVTAYPDGRLPVDAILQHAWASGAAEAFVVRD
jgi:rare lipoprotein A